MNKLRADLSKAKFLDPENTTMTAYRDYDFERRANDIGRLSHAINHFDHAVTQGMVAMKEIASALEAVGQAFTELTLGHAGQPVGPGGVDEEPNPYPTEADMQMLPQFSNPAGMSATGYAQSMASTRLTEETNSQVRRLAKIFAEETRRINEGAPFQSYNMGVHRDVITRLRPVKEHIAGVNDTRRARNDALIKYNRYKAEVEKIEKQYAKKGKPFCNSSSHKKQTSKRDEAWKEYQKRQDKFNETFAMLMEVNDHAAAQIIYQYLALNDEYLHQIAESIGRILPAMEEVYPLNSEYNSLQNSLIVDAVTASRVPFASARPQQQQPGQPPQGPSQFAVSSPLPAQQQQQQCEADMPSSFSRSSEISSICGNANVANNNSNNDDDNDAPYYAAAKKEAMVSVPVTPATTTTPPPPPPNPDAVRAATGTREDCGHVLTQPQRLQTNMTGGSGAAQDFVMPGAADTVLDSFTDRCMK